MGGEAASNRLGLSRKPEGRGSRRNNTVIVHAQDFSQSEGPAIEPLAGPRKIGSHLFSFLAR